MSRLDSLSDGTHPLTPPDGLSSPTAICLTTPPALGLSASANTSNIMDSSGKRARDTTHMEVASSGQKVGQSESSSSQLTKRDSLEAAYNLAQMAIETFHQINREAEEQAKETENKLNKQNISQAKIIEDLRKENDNLKNEKAAVERRAVETQKKIEEATRKIEILKTELQKAQNALIHEFKRGHDRGYEDATGPKVIMEIDDRDDEMPTRKRVISIDDNDGVKPTKKHRMSLDELMENMTDGSDSSDTGDSSSSGSDIDGKSEILRLCRKLVK